MLSSNHHPQHPDKDNDDDCPPSNQSNNSDDLTNHYHHHDFGPNVHISIHPVLSHKITILRSSSTLPGSFRAVMREVTFHLGYEATKTLTTRGIPITVPLPNHHHHHHHHPHSSVSTSTPISCIGSKLVERIALIPILRSGLGMVDSMLELLPNAAIYHIGMYRSKIEHTPIQYFNRLPRQCTSDVAYVLDPVIATASTVISVVNILKKWGVAKIHVVSVLAARPGLQELMEKHPDISMTIGTVDDELREDGTVVPGLGDSGDRLFGTHIHEDEDPSNSQTHGSNGNNGRTTVTTASTSSSSSMNKRSKPNENNDHDM